MSSVKKGYPHTASLTVVSRLLRFVKNSSTWNVYIFIAKVMHCTGKAKQIIRFYAKSVIRFHVFPSP